MHKFTYKNWQVSIWREEGRWVYQAEKHNVRISSVEAYSTKAIAKKEAIRNIDEEEPVSADNA